MSGARQLRLTTPFAGSDTERVFISRLGDMQAFGPRNTEPQLDAPIRALVTALDQLNSSIAGNAAKLLPAVAKASNATDAVKNVSKPFQMLRSAIQAEKRLLVKNAASVKASVTLDPATTSALLAILRTLQAPAALEWAWDRLPVLDALFDSPDHLLLAGSLGNNHEMIQRLRDRWILLNHARLISHNNRQLDTKPSLIEPAPITTDHAAALQLAQDAVDLFEKRHEDCHLCETFLVQISKAVAIACEINASDAFALLNGND